MSTVKYTATTLVGTGKAGVLKPDEHGYYTVILGALNAYNSSGIFYVLEGAKRLLDSSSVFQRRVRDGNLYAELGHPKFLPGMKMSEYIERLHVIAEDNVVAHISEVWLDERAAKENPGMYGKDTVLIMGKVKPDGAMKHALEGAFENPKRNVCFSVRSLAEDVFKNGRVEREIINLITFDLVIESGISFARKWKSPALETLTDVSFSKSEIISKLDDIILSDLALESSKNLALESKSNLMRGMRTSSIITRW